jgi:hypothetical protein
VTYPRSRTRRQIAPGCGGCSADSPSPMAHDVGALLDSEAPAVYAHLRRAALCNPTHIYTAPQHVDRAGPIAGVSSRSYRAYRTGDIQVPVGELPRITLLKLSEKGLGATLRAWIRALYGRSNGPKGPFWPLAGPPRGPIRGFSDSFRRVILGSSPGLSGHAPWCGSWHHTHRWEGLTC